MVQNRHKNDEGLTVYHRVRWQLVVRRYVNLHFDTIPMISTADLNKSATITSSSTELNILKGVTVTKDNINTLANVTTSIKDDLTARYTKTEADSVFAPLSGSANISSVGALVTGSIGGTFGTISTQNPIETTGKISANTSDLGDVRISGSTIGHSSDTDLITLSTGKVIVAGSIEANALTLNNTLVDASASDINKLKDLTTTKQDFENIG